MISGLIWPFYTGYVEGAVEANAPEINRLRGWIYFLSGALTYAWFTALILIELKLPTASYGAFWAGLVSAIFTSLFTLSQLVYAKLIAWTFKVFGYEFKQRDMLTLACASFGGGILTVAFLWLSGTLYLVHDLVSIPGETIIFLTILACFVVFEKTSRALVGSEKLHEAVSTTQIDTNYYFMQALKLTIRRCFVSNRFALALIVVGWAVSFAIGSLSSWSLVIGQLIGDCLVGLAIFRYATTEIALP